jgi:hypothetical protein
LISGCLQPPQRPASAAFPALYLNQGALVALALMPLLSGQPALALLRRFGGASSAARSSLRARAASSAGKLPNARPLGITNVVGDQLFLHVAPDGDSWTATEIFAAKHLPSDFIVSIPLPEGFDPAQLTEAQLQQIYDTKRLPALSDAASLPESGPS